MLNLGKVKIRRAGSVPCTDRQIGRPSRFKAPAGFRIQFYSKNDNKRGGVLLVEKYILGNQHKDKHTKLLALNNG